MQSINLDDLVGNAGEVIRSGVAHPVKPLDGAAYRSLLRLRAKSMTEVEAFETMYKLAANACPTLAATIQTLTLREVSAIVKLAGSHVEAMEQHPKSSKPLTKQQRRKRKG